MHSESYLLTSAGPLGKVASGAERLKVGVVVGAAFDARDDVIDLRGAIAAELANTLIAFEDAGPNRAPLPGAAVA